MVGVTMSNMCQVTVVVGKKRRKFSSMEQAVRSFRFRVLAIRVGRLVDEVAVIFLKELFFVGEP